MLAEGLGFPFVQGRRSALFIALFLSENDRLTSADYAGPKEHFDLHKRILVLGNEGPYKESSQNPPNDLFGPSLEPESPRQTDEVSTVHGSRTLVEKHN